MVQGDKAGESQGTIRFFGVVVLCGFAGNVTQGKINLLFIYSAFLRAFFLLGHGFNRLLQQLVT